MAPRPSQAVRLPVPLLALALVLLALPPGAAQRGDGLQVDVPPVVQAGALGAAVPVQVARQCPFTNEDAKPVRVEAVSAAGSAGPVDGAWGACDVEGIQRAHLNLSLGLAPRTRAGSYGLTVRAVDNAGAAGSAGATLVVPFLATVTVHAQPPSSATAGSSFEVPATVVVDANDDAALALTVVPEGWLQGPPPALPAFSWAAGRATHNVTLPLLPPAGTEGTFEVQVKAVATPVRAQGSAFSGVGGGAVAVAPPAPPAAPPGVAWPLSVEAKPPTDAAPGAPATFAVTAMRSCRAGETVALGLHAAWAGTAGATAPWGPCGQDGIQRAAADLVLAVPEGALAGDHAVTASARAEGATATARTFLRVPFAGAVVVNATPRGAPVAGEPWTLPVQATVSANAPARLTLQVDPPAWAANLPDLGTYDPSEGRAARAFSLTLHPGGTGAAEVRVRVLLRPATGAGEVAGAWTLVPSAAADPQSDAASPPWVAPAVGAGVAAGVAALAWATFRLARHLRDLRHARRGWTRSAPPPAAGASLLPLPRPPRYVNVALAPGDGGPPLPREASLGAGRAYRLLVNVAGLDPRSVVENARENPLRDDLLPPSPSGHWLDVVAVSDELEVPQPRHALFLPPEGASYACPCEPGGPHACAPHERRDWIEVPVRAPPRPCEARVRLGVYFRDSLVQSQLLVAEVAEREGAGRGHASRIDYQLTAAFTDLERMPSPGVHVLTNDNDPSTHRVVMKGAKDVLAFNLAEGQMRGAIDAARKALMDAHAEEYGGGMGAKKQHRNLLDSENRKGKAAFVADLRRLAPLGFTLFCLLFEGRADQRRTVRATLAGPRTTLQVGRTGKSGFVFPWALVYDLALESDETLWRLCPLVESWDGKGAMIPEGATRCPHEAAHGKNVLCPFGFWGYRHHIEQPPSMPPDRGLPVAIRLSGPAPRVAVGLSRELDEKVTATHLGALRAALGGATVHVADTRQGVVQALGADELEVAYFYCHGRRKPVPGASQTIPILAIGKGESFAPTDVQAWCDYDWAPHHWRATSPLVVINGCHTAELTPEGLVSFVDSFADAYAAGVLGTEIAMFQPMASEMAERFLAAFPKHGAGDALLQARLHFLAKGNLLGLAYTLYASSELRLAPPAAPAAPGGTA